MVLPRTDTLPPSCLRTLSKYSASAMHRTPHMAVQLVHLVSVTKQMRRWGSGLCEGTAEVMPLRLNKYVGTDVSKHIKMETTGSSETARHDVTSQHVVKFQCVSDTGVPF